MATEKQRRYFGLLMQDLGRPLDEQAEAEFAQLPVQEASARISKLEEERSSSKALSGPA